MIMRNIYEKATRVVVYLGRLEKFGAFLPSLLPRLAGKVQQNQSPDLDIQPPKVGNFEFWALMDLLDQPWWNRIWVIQEVLVARDVVVWIGEEYVSWSILVNAIFAVAQLSPVTLPHTKHGFMLKMHKHMSNLISIEEIRQQLNYPRSDITTIERHKKDFEYSLLKLLVNFRGSNSTDPRDKVYGLLGLATALMPNPGIEPDYGKSLEECYVDTALAIINQQRDLDIFDIPSRFFNISKSLPSWVPTWIRHESPFERVTFRTGLSDGQWWFSASAGTKFLDQKSLHNQKLLLSGIVADRIQQLADEMPSYRNPIRDRDEPSLLKLVLQSIITLLGVIYDVGAVMDVTYQWKQMAELPNRYENSNQIFVWIMICGSFVDSPENTYRHFMKEWWRFYVSWAIIRRLRIYLLRKLFPNAYRWALAGCWYIFRVKWPGPTDILDYRLGRTVNGRLALVPAFTKAGDEVALLAGGRMPYIVRWKHSHWQFIGHCFVPDMMSGEMWHSNNCHQMEFM
jgi:hypothetical protein